MAYCPRLCTNGVLSQTVYQWRTVPDCVPMAYCPRLCTNGVLSQTVYQWRTVPDCVPMAYGPRLCTNGVRSQTVYQWRTVSFYHLEKVLFIFLLCILHAQSHGNNFVGRIK